jgi:Cu/Ag efflux protein CusF
MVTGLFDSMSRLLLGTLLLASTLAAAHGAPAVTASPGPTLPTAAAPARYPFRGVILGVYPDKGTLLIKHEDIPGLMKGMKMAFRVTPEVFKLVKEGDTITATLIVREDDFWLENVQPVKG